MKLLLCVYRSSELRFIKQSCNSLDYINNTVGFGFTFLYWTYIYTYTYIFIEWKEAVLETNLFMYARADGYIWAIYQGEDKKIFKARLQVQIYVVKFKKE